MNEEQESRPTNWQLVKQAIEHFNREVSYGEIKSHIWKQYPETNTSSITCEIISCSVNHPSRIHYPPNKKARKANGQYDFLFNTKRGHVTPYNPDIHGQWEIVEDLDGGFAIHQISEGEELGVIDSEVEDEGSGLFALEAHLRDYLARNLGSLTEIHPTLRLYESEDGRSAVEFQTDVGPIDVLAVDGEGNFYVLELKLKRGPDSALGQILRYMGWVTKHLANGKQVRGVIIAADMGDKLRYAVSCVPSVKLFSYKLKFQVQSVPEIAPLGLG